MYRPGTWGCSTHGLKVSLVVTPVAGDTPSRALSSVVRWGPPAPLTCRSLLSLVCVAHSLNRADSLIVCSLLPDDGLLYLDRFHLTDSKRRV